MAGPNQPGRPGNSNPTLGSAGFGLSAGFSVGPFSAQFNLGLGNSGQSFSTIPLPNNRLALYALVILDANPPNLPVETFTFPISPSSISKEPTAMTNFYDTSGPAGNAGVQRTPDIYGQSPPIISIEGTTGWQRHSTDGFALTGMESIAAIQTLLNDFAALNRQQQDQNNPNLYLMEFYDYFTDEFWRVVPIGPQVIRQSERRPLLFDYSFRFAALFSVDTAPPPIIGDPILNALLLGGNQAGAQLGASISVTLNSYAAFTAGSFGVSF
jgi:hypothetical protein